jgi:hypothetical protein
MANPVKFLFSSSEAHATKQWVPPIRFATGLIKESYDANRSDDATRFLFLSVITLSVHVLPDDDTQRTKKLRIPL